MKQQPLTRGEQLMRSRLAADLAQQDEKAHKKWRRTDGGLFRFCKAVYYIVAVYSFMVFLLNEIIFVMMYQSDFSMTAAQQTFYRSNQWIVHCLFAVCVVAFVCMLLKKRKAACITQLCAGALLAVQIVQIFGGEYANQTLLGVLYSIVGLAMAAALAILWLSVWEEKRLERAVAKEYNKLYERYGDSEYDLMDTETWNKIVLAYETALQEGKPIPKRID